MLAPQTMKRAAIYARFSTDMQRDKSIEDQVDLCRKHAERLNCEVVAVYSDRARSGASLMGRDGVLDMISASRRGEFDAVIVEALDRLSRDQEDLAGIYKRFTFNNVAIEAVHDGRADQVQIGIRGMLGSLYLADLANKVRRGMTGVIRDGRSPGGRAYGYRPKKGEPGLLDIVHHEAEVVRRIFRAYASGISPRHIAYDLNAEQIPPPRGTIWNASTINGNRKRGNGIIQNPLYKGTMVWNRVRMVRDPDTGKRVSRVNPQTEWQTHETPELAIVDQTLWQRAQDRKISSAQAFRNREFRNKSKHMLSGLLRCGHCGSGMSMDGFRDGHHVVRCSRSRESGTCKKIKRVRLDQIEETVVRGLRDELSQPGVLTSFVDEYQAEMRRLSEGEQKDLAKARKKVEEADIAIQRIVRSIASGLISDEDARTQIEELKIERERQRGILASNATNSPVIEIQPHAIEHYQQVLDRLCGIAVEAARSDSATQVAIREFIQTVKVFTEPATSIQVTGRLAALTGANIPGKQVKTGVSVVAGEGFEPPTPGL
jgi:site-specific DNA recombinase